MTHALVINSSINGDAGNSSVLAKHFSDQWLAGEGNSVTVRTLDPALGHLSGEEMQAWMQPAADRTPAQQALAAISEGVIADVQAADVIVLGMPMYNFAVPSLFKAWADRLARAGITFKYTEQGPVGLLSGKRVIVLAARGGRYAGTPKDTQTGFLRDFFAFLGLTDVDFIYAEGLAMGDEPRIAAMAAAEAQIEGAVSALLAGRERSAA